MTADALLSRLDKVKRTAPGRWMARCPAHDDKGPSLSVREIEDGRVLLHCFAGCDVSEVLSAVGLEMDALFPPRPLDGHKPERRAFSAEDALRALDFEATLIHLCAETLAAGKPLSDTDLARLTLAAERVSTAMGAVWTH